jgi:hypothetical protein
MLSKVSVFIAIFFLFHDNDNERSPPATAVMTATPGNAFSSFFFFCSIYNNYLQLDYDNNNEYPTPPPPPQQQWDACDERPPSPFTQTRNG